MKSKKNQHRRSIVRLARRETDPHHVHEFTPITKGRTYALVMLALLAIPILLFLFIHKVNPFKLRRKI